MALSGSELSLHHDLDEAVKNHSVPGLLNCKFYELVTVTRSDIFHAACRAERTKRDAAMQKSQEKDTELRFAASTLGIEMEEEE
jgi:hypothetical protein